MSNTIDKAYLEQSGWKSDLFKGKVVFVTGGTGGICRVQAEALVALGANAALIGRNESKAANAAKEVAELRPDAKIIGLGGIDVRDVKSIAKAVEETVKQLGKIDIVIAGAAGNFLADFNHLSSNGFKTVIDIDLLGAYNTAKATFSELRKSKGSYIFISATLHYYGVPFQSHAGAAKAGIDALSQALAVELGPIGIRSNCIAPGAIKGTEGMDRLAGGGTDMAAKIPLQRLGETRDIANSTVYLCSPAASYVSGTVQVVDGAFWHLGSPMAQQLYPDVLINQNMDEHSKL